jgi:hypothetical protein
MRTPLKRGLDDEIFAVEERIARRRSDLPRLARSTGRRVLHAIASPAGLAAAAALGFLLGGAGTRRARPAKPEKQPRKGGGALKLGTQLLMTGALALIRAQFGSPAGLAQHVLERLPSRSPGGRTHAAPH